ncbi:MAG: hypothetical protein K2L70_04505 [Clostridia bacterium]|nr:hypothetical protein [Clostridia bacterium]
MDNLIDIDKMAKILKNSTCDNLACAECDSYRCLDYIRAKKLAKAGIGDVNQAITDFAIVLCARFKGYDLIIYDGENAGIYDSGEIAKIIKTVVKGVLKK